MAERLFRMRAKISEKLSNLLKPAEKPAERLAERPVESQAEWLANTPVESQAEWLVETPVESQAEWLVSTPVESQTEWLAETPVESQTEWLAETPVESQTEWLVNTPVERPAERELPEERPAKCPVCYCRDYHRIELIAGSEILCHRFSSATEDGCQTCWVLLQAMMHFVPNALSSSNKLHIRGSWPQFNLSTFDESPGIRTYHDVFYISASKNPGLQFKQSPSGYTGSDEAWQKAIIWIQTCIETHQCSASSSTNSLPTRILDLGEGVTPSTVKLYVSQRESARYVCLSHCWGTYSTPVVLETQNFDSWVKGLLVTKLPIMYQQAIFATKRLGIRYLWIDSLCIVQDNVEDWQEESKRMADVYQNSYLTIAATSSIDETDPIFRKSSPAYTWKKLSNKGETSIFCFQQNPYHGSFWLDSRGDQKNLPLLSRAWVYQERLLSPRVLHFTPEELLFECSEGSKCECGSIAISFDPRYLKAFYRSKSSNATELWQGIVLKYLALHLTFAKDKLPALSGIAKRIEAFHSDQYLAGLWLSNLHSHLSWVTIKPQQRGRKWKAPSWSWAAIDSPADGFLLEDQRRPSDSFPIVIEAICEPVGIDPHGEVRSGYIKLRSYSIEAVLTYQPLLEYKILVIEGHRDGDVHIDYILNDAHQVFQPTQCLLFFLGSNTSWYIHRHSFLILIPAEGGSDNMYQRIGICEYRDVNMDLYSEKTIVII